LLSYFERNVAIELAAMARARLGLDQRRSDVVDYVIALAGNNLQRLNVAVLGEPGID